MNQDGRVLMKAVLREKLSHPGIMVTHLYTTALDRLFRSTVRNWQSHR